jgi:hypothetical protein
VYNLAQARANSIRDRTTCHNSAVSLADEFSFSYWEGGASLRPVTSPSLLPPRSPQADILLAERIHTGGPTAEDEFARLFRDKVFVMSLARTSLLSGRSPRGLRDQRLVVIADEAARFHVGLDPKPSNQRLVLVQALAAFMFVLVFHGLFCSLRFFENS